MARQVVRGSKSNEVRFAILKKIYYEIRFLLLFLFQLLNQSLRNFTQVDIVSDYSAQNLNKMSLILQHVSYHYDAMNDSCHHLDYLKEQVTAMER